MLAANMQLILLICGECAAFTMSGRFLAVRRSRFLLSGIIYIQNRDTSR